MYHGVVSELRCDDLGGWCCRLGSVESRAGFEGRACSLA